ncbi:hypothetical protein HZA97_08580 [Candidatus Woesearchaeota archaeon]|nr:hypothetical protein [Candidatus Woesearchaeota archaeon]
MLIKNNLLFLFIVFGIVFIIGCSQTVNQVQNNSSNGQDQPQDKKYDQNYCEQNSDCVTVVYGGCGTIVVNKEAAKDWDPEGPICAVGRIATNPRCENSKCVADYVQD